MVLQLGENSRKTSITKLTQSGIELAGDDRQESVQTDNISRLITLLECCQDMLLSYLNEDCNFFFSNTEVRKVNIINVDKFK